MAAKKAVAKARKTAPASKKAAAHKPAAKPTAAARKAAESTAKKPAAAARPAATAKPAARVAAPPPAPSAAAVKSSRGPQTRGVTAIATMKSPPVLHPGPADDGDAESAASLLAGPRNVKPYVMKRGERYMSQEQLQHFRTILQSWKRDLMMEVDRTVTHMKDEAANFPDPNDRATQEEEFSLELRTRDRERKLIRKIDEALSRVDDGSYGYCLETGEEIGIKRLEARPVATLTIEAQERRERRERQYGDREDRYR